KPAAALVDDGRVALRHPPAPGPPDRTLQREREPPRAGERGRPARRRRRRGQVGEQRVQVRVRPGGQRRPTPLVELGVVQPALGERVLHPLHHHVPLPVRSARTRATRHNRRMLIVWCLLVLWHPSAPVGRRHDDVLPSVATIAIYRNPVTWAMRSVEAFSPSFTNRPPGRPLTAPRLCRVVAAGRTETGISVRQDAL